MKKIIMLMTAVVLSMTVSRSQNLDPTVEVSRVYEGKLIEVHKPVLAMSVPDTVYRFDLEFDYSVFDNPYKGSYEFNPYMMSMRPVSSLERSQKTFYVLAGAGYTLYPVLDLLWSPALKGPFSVNVFAAHNSYVGEYRALNRGSSWNGYDLCSRVGADFGYDWKKAGLSFGVAYNGIAGKDYMKKREYDAADVYVSLKSKTSWSEHFGYEVTAGYRFAEDKSDAAAHRYLQEHNFNIDASFGPRFANNSRMMFDVGVDLNMYSGAMQIAAGGFCFVPHYVYRKGIFTLDAGVRASVVPVSGTVAASKGQFVYPDVRVDLAVIPDAMKFYLHAGGGERFSTYASLLEGNHHMDPGYALQGESVMGVTVERVSAVTGIEGRISDFFSYDLRGGYVFYANRMFDSVIKLPNGELLPGVMYSGGQKWFAALDWRLDLQSVRVDGTLEYQDIWDVSSESIVLPAALCGDVSAVYNWNRRIYAGIDCRFATSRRSTLSVIPWYADLGVYGEYAMNRRLSFWLRAGNLMDMEIQRNLLFAEKGINFTAGICLTL